MRLLTILRPFFIFLVITGISLSVQAKEYTIPELRIEVQINEDGSLRITEYRTYVFDGSYSWANYRIPKSRFSGLEDIRVMEGDENLVNRNTEETGTFLVEESSKAFNIKWFFAAEDEQRTFSISYTIKGALTIGPEWSQLFWNYAASGRERSTDTITIILQLPEEVAQSDLHSWVREPAWKISTSELYDGFQFNGSDIGRNQAVIIRTVFPTSVLSEQVSINDTDFSLTWVENAEAEYREEQRQQEAENARLYDLAITAVIILAGLSILSFIFFYRKYGSRHKIRISDNNSIMIPGRQKPAAIGWLLLNRTVLGAHVTATLLDLARRGYFKIKEYEDEEEESWLSAQKDNNGYMVLPLDKGPDSDSALAEYENDLLKFVTGRIEEEGNKMEDIFKFSDSEVSKWFYAWKKKLNTHSKDQNWIDNSSYKGVYLNLGVQSILLIIGVILIFMLHPIMAIAMGVSFVAAILSLAIIRRTPKGEEVFRTWSNYKKALKNAKEHSISEDKLGLHFIYGIALGLSKQHFEQMFEQHPDAVLLITWIAILPGSSSSPAAIASSFSTLAATGTISASGGSFAGGASAGAAGGGASGGAG